jgi:hypothetical protein
MLVKASSPLSPSRLQPLGNALADEANDRRAPARWMPGGHWLRRAGARRRRVGRLRRPRGRRCGGRVRSVPSGRPDPSADPGRSGSMAIQSKASSSWGSTGSPTATSHTSSNIRSTVSSIVTFCKALIAACWGSGGLADVIPPLRLGQLPAGEAARGERLRPRPDVPRRYAVAGL